MLPCEPTWTSIARSFSGSERAGSERRAIHDRWCAEPADQCGDRDDVEFIDQTGPQEGAVEPASGLRYQALCAELRPDLRQRGRQIHPAGAGEEVGNPLLAQVGEVRQGRAATGYDQQACLLIAPVRPCHPAAGVHDGEPPQAAVRQEVRPQHVSRHARVRKMQ
jgi:hypothetical protein